MDNKIKILIIDDHKLLRTGLKSLFEKSHDIVVVAEAESGREGIEKIKAHKIDLAIVDMGLGDITGVEVVKGIAEISPNTRILVLSSHDTINEILEALKAGANGYVLKDVKDDDLLLIVKMVARGGFYLDYKIADGVRKTSSSIVPKQNHTRAGFKARHANLTEREYEVLKLVVDGKSNQQIADTLCISEHTSKAHVCSIIQKLLVDDRTQAAVKAIKEGLV